MGAAVLCSHGFSPPRGVMSPPACKQYHDVSSASKLHSRHTILYSSPAVSVTEFQAVSSPERKLNKIQSAIVRTLMMAFIASMCAALPLTLFPVWVLYRLKIIDRVQKEKMSLRVGQFCSRWLLRLFPFARKKVIVEPETLSDPQPAIWVCNHISMLDLFFVLALDKQMRGKNRRPIKCLYWKGLEANPITGLLCKMCGFIPVDMSDNGNGNANEYDPKSFKQMLKSTKNAIKDGFDIAILPEGQPNPTPENGLQPVYSGAFTLAKMSRRPIQMISLHGLHHMWHPDENIGMACTARDMALYWKGLEANPITGLLCKMCGFIPVDMSDNGNGNANEYDPKSFKQMLKSTKNAIKDGFDIAILPEGQPNPTPENGLQPVYSGAFTLAKMSRRPIQMISLHGLHHMWHPDENIGMACTARDMAVRVYPCGRLYKDSEEFTSTFSAVVGHFGAHGKDLDPDELKLWLDGSIWETEMSRRYATRMIVEDVVDDKESKPSKSTEEGARTSSP